MVRTIVFFAYFWVSVLFLAPIGLVLLVLDLCGLRAISSPVIGLIVRLWARTVVWGTGTKAVLSGLENVPKDKRLVFVSNHQGDMDFVMILAFMKRPIGFIIKSQALYLPFINIWITAIGSIFLNRDSLAKGKRSIDRGVRKIMGGRAMCIFPEGTRSRSSALGVFRNGSFKLATRAGAVIVPVTFDGSYRTWEQNKKITPSTITMHVHPPIPTEGMTTEERKALPDRVRSVIASALPR